MKERLEQVFELCVANKGQKGRAVGLVLVGQPVIHSNSYQESNPIEVTILEIAKIRWFGSSRREATPTPLWTKARPNVWRFAKLLVDISEFEKPLTSTQVRNQFK